MRNYNTSFIAINRHGSYQRVIIYIKQASNATRRERRGGERGYTIVPLSKLLTMRLKTMITLAKLTNN